MRLRHFQTWKFEYLFVAPEQWQREHETNFVLKQYELLGVWDATTALRRLAQRDAPFLMSLACSVGASQLTNRVEPTLQALIRGLGRSNAQRQDPPSTATFYVARRKREQTFQEPLDPWKNVREAIEAAEQAPRGFVVVEVVDEDGHPVPGLRLELLLADGQFRSLTTNAEGTARLDPIPQGECHIRVPELDGSSWRPAEGAASTRVDQGRKLVHVVQHGECLVKIVHRHGIKDWKKVWESADNTSLRKKRKNPSILRPGDQLTLPGLAVHEIVRATDATHRIVVKALLAELRVVLQDHNQFPFADEPYELYVQGEKRTGQTDASGNVVEQVPSHLKSVEIVLPAHRLRWRLELSALHDITSAHEGDAADTPDERALTVKALQARLNALGFPCGRVDGVLGPRTMAALKLFQGQTAASSDEPAAEETNEVEPSLLAQVDKAFEASA